MKPSFISVLMFVADALKQNVRFVGLRDCHHLNLFLSKSHNLREGEFANFAFEFGKVVRLNDPLDFFFDL